MILTLACNPMLPGLSNMFSISTQHLSVCTFSHSTFVEKLPSQRRPLCPVSKPNPALPRLCVLLYQVRRRFRKRISKVESLGESLTKQVFWRKTLRCGQPREARDTDVWLAQHPFKLPRPLKTSHHMLTC